MTRRAETPWRTFPTHYRLQTPGTGGLNVKTASRSACRFELHGIYGAAPLAVRRLAILICYFFPTAFGEFW